MPDLETTRPPGLPAEISISLASVWSQYASKADTHSVAYTDRTQFVPTPCKPSNTCNTLDCTRWHELCQT